MISVKNLCKSFQKIDVLCGIDYEIKEGEVIGGVGESILVECAEEPHLHFEVMSGGEYVDPMSYFE